MAKNMGPAEMNEGHQQTRGGRTSGHGTIRSATTGMLVTRSQEGSHTVREVRISTVLSAAQRSGLLEEKSARIGVRVSPTLVRAAKSRTGIDTDTDLIEYALASVPLEDRFAEAFQAVQGTVDADLDLGI